MRNRLATDYQMFAKTVGKIWVGFFRHAGEGFLVSFSDDPKRHAVDIFVGCASCGLDRLPKKLHKKVSNICGQIIASVPKEEMPPIFLEAYKEVLEARGIKRPRKCKPGPYESFGSRPVLARFATFGHGEHEIEVFLPETSEECGASNIFQDTALDCSKILSNVELLEIRKQCRQQLKNSKPASSDMRQMHKEFLAVVRDRVKAAA